MENILQKDVPEATAVPRHEQEMGSLLGSSNPPRMEEDILVERESTSIDKEVQSTAPNINTIHTTTEFLKSANSDQVNHECRSSESTETSPGSGNSAELANASASAAALTPWFFRRRQFASDRFLLCLLFGLAGTQLLALTLSFLLINYITGSDEHSEDCLSLDVSFFYLLASSGEFVQLFIMLRLRP